jgi:hypothetical protein
MQEKAGAFVDVQMPHKAQAAFHDVPWQRRQGLSPMFIRHLTLTASKYTYNHQCPNL